VSNAATAATRQRFRSPHSCSIVIPNAAAARPAVRRVGSCRPPRIFASPVEEIPMKRARSPC
jgi:hypothetical protein